MLNIVITAGGTSEPIDNVRKITNSSTGKLGAIITEKLIQRNDINKIFYIKAKKAVMPHVGVIVEAGLSNKLEVIEIESTIDLKNAVEHVLTNNSINYFIHSMAVSDYYVDYVSTIKMLSDEMEHSNPNDVLNNPTNKFAKQNKLSSHEDNLVVMLKPTPKIIGLIKTISPKTTLIGFKLLDNVPEEELIRIASELRDKNKCDYVVANDLAKIRSGKHEALIIDRENAIQKASTKQEIANILDGLVK